MLTHNTGSNIHLILLIRMGIGLLSFPNGEYVLLCRVYTASHISHMALLTGVANNPSESTYPCSLSPSCKDSTKDDVKQSTPPSTQYFILIHLN